MLDAVFFESFRVFEYLIIEEKLLSFHINSFHLLHLLFDIFDLVSWNNVEIKNLIVFSLDMDPHELTNFNEQCILVLDIVVSKRMIVLQWLAFEEEMDLIDW